MSANLHYRPLHPTGQDISELKQILQDKYNLDRPHIMARDDIPFLEGVKAGNPDLKRGL